MNWPIAVALVSALCNGTIGVLSYVRGRRESLYRTLSLLSFSFAFWSLAYLKALPGFDDPFWMKVLFTPLAWIPAATLSFILSFTGCAEAAGRRRTLPLYLLGAGLLGMLWCGAVSLRVYRAAFLAGGLPVFGLGIGLLYRHWRRAEDPAERNRRGYMLAASAIAVAGGLSDFLPFAGIRFPGPGNIALSFYSLIVLAAIGRHHLLDLRAAAKQAVLILAVSLMLSLALTGIAWMTRQLDGRLFLNFFVLSLLLMAVLPALWERLYRVFGRWFFARNMSREQVLDDFEREAERSSDAASLSDAARRAVFRAWEADCEILWSGRALRRLEPGPALPEELRVLLETKPVVSTRDTLAREKGFGPLHAALRDRRAQAAVPVIREGELVAAALVGAPADGFYDLSGVRWLTRFAAALGRAVQRAETSAALLHADRMVQLGALAAGVAHEVRNPLSAMRGAAELLGSPIDEKSRGQYLDVLKEEILRLDGIVTELLDYASPGTQQARCDWPEVWGRVERLVRSDWPERVVLECNAQPLCLAVTPAHLHQILLNLLRNAMLAVSRARSSSRDESGRATKTAGPCPPSSRSEVIVAAAGRGRWVVLEVSDNGPGIEAGLLPRLFTPFVKAGEGGAGLGLATVKRLAELYGGRVSAENLSPGARFTVELPLA